MKNVLVGLIFASIVFSCSKKKEEEEAPTAEQANAATLSIPVPPASALKAVSTTMTSVSEVKSPKGNTMNPSVLAIPLADVTKYCRSTGTPIDGVNDGGEGKYAALFAYCNFAMHPDGPDTVLGAIDRVQGVLCALGDLTYDGVERTIKMKFTTACFSSTFVKMVEDELGAGKEFDAVVTATTPVNSSFGSVDYEKSITFNIAAINFSYDILYQQSASVLSAAIKEGTGIDSDGTYFAVKLDRGATLTSNGTLAVDGRFTTKTEQNGGTPSVRHVRTFAKGKYDLTTNSMTSLSSIEFISADYNSSGSAYLRSVKGNPTNGVYAVSAQVNSGGLTDYAAYATAASSSATNVYCFGDGDCAGNTGINISSAADLKFLTSCKLDHADYINAKTMFLRTGPLAFTGVTLSE